MGRCGTRLGPATGRSRAWLGAPAACVVLACLVPATAQATVQAPACDRSAPARGWCGDGGPATGARLASPGSIVVLPGGGFAFADALNSAIRAVAPDGTIRTLARLGGAAGCAPSQLALSPGGDLLAAAPECGSVFRITARGAVSAIAGAGAQRARGAAAQLVAPTGVAAAPGGAILIADDGAIVRLDPRGTARRLRLVPPIHPLALLAMPGGQLLASGGTAGVVWGVDPASGRTRVVLGRPVVQRTRVGPVVAHFDPAIGMPGALAALPGGGFAFADSLGARVRRVDSAGDVATIAGNGADGFGGDGGPPRAARLSDPAGVAIRGDGGVLIADAGNDRIRLVAPPAGPIRTIAGAGLPIAVPVLPPGSPGGRVHYPAARDEFYLYGAPITARRGRPVVVRIYTSQPAQVTVVVRRGRHAARFRGHVGVGIGGVPIGSFRPGRYRVLVSGVSGRQPVGGRTVLVVR